MCSTSHAPLQARRCFAPPTTDAQLPVLRKRQRTEPPRVRASTRTGLRPPASRFDNSRWPFAAQGDVRLAVPERPVPSTNQRHTRLLTTHCRCQRTAIEGRRGDGWRKPARSDPARAQEKRVSGRIRDRECRRGLPSDTVARRTSTMPTRQRPKAALREGGAANRRPSKPSRVCPMQLTRGHVPRPPATMPPSRSKPALTTSVHRTTHNRLAAPAWGSQPPDGTRPRPPLPGSADPWIWQAGRLKPRAEPRCSARDWPETLTPRSPLELPGSGQIRSVGAMALGCATARRQRAVGAGRGLRQSIALEQAQNKTSTRSGYNA